MKKNTFIYIAICSIGFIACEPEFDQPLEDNPITQEKGDADFSTFVSLGNSLTAGFADNALYIDGQKDAFPNLIADKMKAAGGGEFTTPFMTDNVGGFQGFESSFGTRLILGTDAQGNRGPINLNENVATNNIAARAEGSSFNNLGVPGIKSYQFGADGLGNPVGLQTNPISANPYFVRFASTPSTSILKDALAKQPSFFTLWLGNNDVLSYATSGGVGVNQTDPTVSPADYGSNDITNPLVYGQLMTDFTTALTANGAKGVVVNIPNVTSIPFFTTVPNNALVLNAEQARSLTTYFQGYVGILIQAAITPGVTQAVTEATIAGQTPEQIAQVRAAAIAAGTAEAAPLLSQYAFTFNPGPNRFLIKVPETPTNPRGIKQMTSNELLLLTINQGALRTEGYGSVAVTPEVLAIGAKLAALQVNPAAPQVTPEEGMTYLAAVNAIEDKDALDTEELTAIDTSVKSYNESLKTITDANPNIALYNANSDLKALSSGGITSEGVTVTSTFVTGGAFSLDGVHLTPRGNAVIANKIMGVINGNFNSTLQSVDPNLFPFLTIP